MTVIVQEQVYNLNIQGDAGIISVSPESLALLEVGTPGPQGPASGSTGYTFTAGASLSALRVVKVDPTNERVYYADTTTLGDAGLSVGVTLASALVGSDIAVLTEGYLHDSNWSWNTSGDKRLYLSTNGQIIQGPPTTFAFTQLIGVVTSATSIVVKMAPSILG